MQPELLFEIKNLKKSFGGKLLFDSFSLTMCESETVALVGESGSGKSTLCKILLGLTGFDEGICRRKKDAFLIFQNPVSSLNPKQTIEQVLQEPLSLKKRGGDIHAMLSSVCLPQSTLKKTVRELSGGEAQRVAIARALLFEAKLLILDESLSSLDLLTAKEIVELLATLQKEKRFGLLFVTHNLPLLTPLKPKIVKLTPLK